MKRIIVILVCFCVMFSTIGIPKTKAEITSSGNITEDYENGIV